jgi:hypothetical protein
MAVVQTTPLVIRATYEQYYDTSKSDFYLANLLLMKLQFNIYTYSCRLVHIIM